jgi:hypothetical protein
MGHHPIARLETGSRTYGRPNVITGQPVKVNGVAYYWLRATALVN